MESRYCLLLKNSRWWPGTSFGTKVGFLSRHLSEPLLLIYTVWMTLVSDAQMTKLIWPTFLLHYAQNFQIPQLCFSTMTLLCLVHVYTCYNDVIYNFTSLTSFLLHFPLYQVTTYHKTIITGAYRWLTYFIFTFR